MTNTKRCRSRFDPDGTATPCVRSSGHRGKHRSKASPWEDPSSGEQVFGGRIYRMEWIKPRKESPTFIKAKTSGDQKS